MCRSIHAREARNASRHIPREACPRLSKLEAGRPTIIFQGCPIRKDPSHFSPAPAYHELTPVSIHNFIFYQQARAAFLASSPVLGKASDACMPFVPVSMGSYYSVIYCFPTLFPSCLSFFCFLALLRLCISLLVAATIARALRAYHNIHHFLPTPQNSIAITTKNHMPPSPRTAYFWRPSSARKST